jgi:hypothetical protein
MDRQQRLGGSRGCHSVQKERAHRRARQQGAQRRTHQFVQRRRRGGGGTIMAARMVAMVAAIVMLSMPAMGASRVGALVERAKGLSLGDELTEAAADAARYVGKLHKRFNEIKYLPGHTKRNDFVKPLPHSYVGAMPEQFHWGNVSGRSYLTYMFNQHIPQCE